MVFKYVKWDITSKCNLRCSHCSVGKNYFNGKVKELSLSQKLEIIDKLASGGVEGISLLGGEPLTMEADLISVIEYAISKGFKISLVTNGLLLREEVMKKVVDSGISHITISLDGATKVAHETMRGKGTFEKLIHNVSDLTNYIRQAKSPLQVNINTVLTRLNYPQMEEIIDLCMGLKVNQWTLLSLGCVGFAEDHKENLAITPYEEIDATKRIIQRCSLGNLQGLNVTPQVYPLVFDYIKKVYGFVMPKQRICCNASISLGFVAPDGNMYPCDRVPGESYLGRKLGDTTIRPMSLLHNSFYEIWNMDYYVKMFNLILSEKTYENYQPCNHCKYLKNGYCNPCPLYSIDSIVRIETCLIAERILGNISASKKEIALIDGLFLPTERSTQDRGLGGEVSTEQIFSKVPMKAEGTRSFDKGEFLILLNPYRVEFTSLNLIGKAIWNLIDGENTVQEIADEIVDVAHEVREVVFPRAARCEIRPKLNEKILDFFVELLALGLIRYFPADQPLMLEPTASSQIPHILHPI